MREKLLFLVASLFISQFAARASCTISPPKNFKVASVTSCTADLSWSTSVNAAYYIIQYKLSTSSKWVQVNVGNVTTYTLAGLKATSTYNFEIAAYCSDNTSSGFTATISKKTFTCTTPFNLTVSNITSHEAKISWQTQCGASNYTVKYKPAGSPTWLTISDVPQLSQQLTGLVAKTNYQYKVAGVCDTSTSNYTAVFSFMTLDSSKKPIHKPNILVFLLDDARYDQFIPNGGPSWFQTPNINSIATQGANFQVCVESEAQCAPSRISIYTGLYPHHHGALNNLTHYNSCMPLVQQILKDYGYYTGFVGKYGQNQGNPMGFNYWAISTDDDYLNPPYIVNNNDTSIPGHITDVYYQLAKTFLNSIPSGKPFMLMFFTRVPHSPAIPRVQDSSKYDTDTMPFPSNFYSYDENYPSFYYAEGRSWTRDTASTDNYKLKEFQTLYGAEVNMDSLFLYLQKKNILDSTIVIFSSDNGFLEGEHMMSDKEVALEESFKVPLFVRYPKWFTVPKTITNNIVSNIDIAPTLLDVAGIPNTYNMDGLSLRNFYNTPNLRQTFYYEFGKQKPIPSIRAVRTLNYTYAYDYCTSTTQEFYDLIKDPKEDTNRINSDSYQPLIDYYQTVLDSLKNATGDTISQKTLTCNLQNPETSKIPRSEISSSVLVHLQPNPASNGPVELAFYDPSYNAETISIFDDMGRTVWSKNYNGQSNYIYEKLDVSGWKQGMYIVRIEEQNRRFTRKFIVQH